MTKNPEEIVAIGAAMLAELNPARLALRAAGEICCAVIQEHKTRERMRMEMEDARRRAIDQQSLHERRMKHNNQVERALTGGYMRKPVAAVRLGDVLGGDQTNGENMNVMPCQQCGFETDEFEQGVCLDCYKDNQARLDQHNAEYDHWQTLGDEQKSDAIKRAIDAHRVQIGQQVATRVDEMMSEPVNHHMPDCVFILLNHLESLMDTGVLSEDAIPVDMWNEVSTYNINPPAKPAGVSDAAVCAACRAFYGERWLSMPIESPIRWMQAAIEAADKARGL